MLMKTLLSLTQSLVRSSSRRATVAAIVASALASSAALAQHSVARQWNDTMLNSIKKDVVRPPVQARNLFHVSAAMYDAWAAYDTTVQGYFFVEKHSAKNVEAARHESISYAAYRVMKHRFALSPNAVIINGYLNAQMTALGFSTEVTTTVGSSPAAIGNRIAALVIAQGFTDNSHEEVNHAKYANTYLDVNLPLVVGLPL